MDQNQIDLIQQSFHSLMRNRNALAEGFYKELFRLDPNLRQLFPGNMEDQRLKLSESLIVIVQSLDDHRHLEDYLSSLGERHSQEFQTKPEYYNLFRQAFIKTLADQSGELWTDDLEQAWSSAIDQISSYMITTP